VIAAPPANPGFEAGLMGWSIGGNVTTRTGVEVVNDLYEWTVAPYQTRLCAMTPDASLGGTWEETAAALMLPAGAQTYLTGAFASSGGAFAATDFAWLHTDLQLAAGESVTLAWNHVSGDALPYNDASAATFVCLDDPAVRGRIDGHPAQVELLGAVQPGSARCATDDFGATGWQTIVFQADTAGRYRLGWMVFNLTDDRRDPWLLVDELAGSTLCDGVAFAALSPDPAAPLQPLPAVPTPVPTTAAPTTAVPTTAAPTTETTAATSPTTPAGTTSQPATPTTAATQPTASATDSPAASTSPSSPDPTEPEQTQGGTGFPGAVTSPSTPTSTPSLPPTGESGPASGTTALVGAFLVTLAGAGAAMRYRRCNRRKTRGTR
jgi:hypothetical protein